jgi:hypothetical protein
MISQVDIDDMQPERIKADNHAGWGVQIHSKEGWVWIDPTIFPKKPEASGMLMMYIAMWPKSEFRVYEHVLEAK